MTEYAARDSPPRAFTLVEVLIGLALGVVLLIAVQSLVVHAYRVSVSIGEQSARDAARELPFELLRQDLDALTRTGNLTLEHGVLSLGSLSAMQSQRLAPRHAVRVRYAPALTDTGAYRLLRIERELGDACDVRTGVVVAGGLRSITFEVFDGREWHGTWPPRVTRRPHAVRLRIVDGRGQPRERIVRLAPQPWRRHDA